MSSTIYYKFLGDDVDYLSENKNGNKDLPTRVNWIGFKQQFFTSVLIADRGFANGKISTMVNDSITRGIKTCSAQITIPFDENSKQSFPMRMYFGPNHFKTLKSYHLDLEHQIPLGWSSPYILGWINRIAVIPVFNWLSSFGMNYGIIILILTILLKIVLFPIAYKTYLSSAKMRVLKPEIDEINKKIPKEKTMERQQATMALYKKAGVNPLAGCIPMLLQMPILIAFYRFFPASIELRQQSFLWATDLSAYDSILNLGFNIPFYGDHVSLFTLLMTVSTIFYTKLNNQLMGSQAQMPGMKFMTYAMPIMFLGFFNNFAAGLSYYYFLANMLTFLQMWVIRRSVNEEAIHMKIQENKKRPEKKKSGFQKRLEDMAKQRGYNPPKKK
jgi:YidC/Oxa1 family membrane protein insertase